MATPPKRPDHHRIQLPRSDEQENLQRKRKRKEKTVVFPLIPSHSSSSLQDRVSTLSPSGHTSQPTHDEEFPGKRRRTLASDSALAYEAEFEDETDFKESELSLPPFSQRLQSARHQALPVVLVSEMTSLPIPDFSTNATATQAVRTPPQSPTHRSFPPSSYDSPPANRQLFSVSSYDSPPDTRTFTLPNALPPTPAKSTHRVRFEDREDYKTFPGCQLARTSSSRFTAAQSYWTYSTATGKTHVLVCQPTSKGCGPAAATMLLLDLVPSDQEGRLLPGRADSFTTGRYWTWHMTKQLANVQNLADTMNAETTIGDLGYKAVPVIYYYSRSEYERALKTASESTDIHERMHVSTESALLSDLQNKLTVSGQPVILAITHHKLAGHFITVDEYKPDTDEYFVRDPYSNHAYKIDAEDLEAVIDSDEDNQITMVYLQPVSLSS